MNAQTENSETTAPYEEMHWKTLESLMIAEGQEWVDKEHAVNYLNSLDSQDASQDDPDEQTDQSNQEDNASQGDESDGTDESTDDESGEDPVDDGDDVVSDDDLVTEPEDKSPAFDCDCDYGTVSGSNKVRYFQHGNYFDASHNYVAPEDID